MKIIENLINNFHDSHNRLYSYTLPESGVEIGNIKIQALGKLGKNGETTVEEGDSLIEREVFYEETGWEVVKVFPKEIRNR